MADVPTQRRTSTALHRAVAYAGSQSALARVIGVRQSTVSKWLSSGSDVPAEHVLTVEAATGISRHELRPDLYPLEDATPPPDPAADRLEGVRP